MKHTKMTAMLLSLLLLTGCGAKGAISTQTVDLSASLSSNAAKTEKTDALTAAQDALTVSLLQAAMRADDSKNYAFSTLALAQSLAAIGSGAAGDTCTEIRNVFGGTELNPLNEQLSGWAANQDSGQLHHAVSVWGASHINFHLPENYAGGADFFSSPFDDTTLADMNQWVSKRTNGIIPQLIDELDKNEVFDLLSAMTFDAKWDNTYTSDDIRDSTFHGKDSSRSANFMYKEEDQAVYLQDSQAVGLMRDYKGGRYAFGALMPYNTELAEYAAQLTPESFRKILNSGFVTEMQTGIPEFSIEDKLDLKPVLMEMGIKTAYDKDQADFSGLCDTRIWFTRTVQQTAVKVNRHGTTVSVGMDFGAVESCAAAYSVTLNSPFIWFIYDNDYGMPVMIGTVQNIEG